MPCQDVRLLVPSGTGIILVSDIRGGIFISWLKYLSFQRSALGGPFQISLAPQKQANGRNDNPDIGYVADEPIVVVDEVNNMTMTETRGLSKPVPEVTCGTTD